MSAANQVLPDGGPPWLAGHGHFDDLLTFAIGHIRHSTVALTDGNRCPKFNLLDDRSCGSWLDPRRWTRGYVWCPIEMLGHDVCVLEILGCPQECGGRFGSPIELERPITSGSLTGSV